MNTIWKTTLDGVDYDGVFSKYGIVFLMPGAAPANGFGQELGKIDTFPLATLGKYINTLRAAGIPYVWCHVEEFPFSLIWETVAPVDSNVGELAERIADLMETKNRYLDDLRQIHVQATAIATRSYVPDEEDVPFLIDTPPTVTM